LGATRRTKNGHDLRKEVVRVISTMPQVIHEGDAVIPLLVGVLEEEVGEPLQVDVVLEQRWCYEAKRPNLKLKAQPKQLLGSLQLASALPVHTQHKNHRHYKQID
jgi:hypothetical protein